ncbi:barstar family protein [Streptomyces sp. ME03-5709C]|nr:barstar family protein [Streptomyces sp. ME03-5709C]
MDVTVHLWSHDARPRSGWVRDLIRTGRLDGKGLRLGPAGRHLWLSVAHFSRERRSRGDAPAGQAFRPNGLHAVDDDSFHCASGEAVNGPGDGYFGWMADALDDCLIGGWGASTPYTPEWNHSDLTRSRLTSPYRLAGGEGATLFESVPEILGGRGAEVILR